MQTTSLNGKLGAGKTDVVEGLAYRIIAGDMPSSMQIKHSLLTFIMSLDVDDVDMRYRC